MNRRTLVTCYVNPDIDGLAGATAYGEFLNHHGRDVSVMIMGVPHEEARYVMDRFQLEYPETIDNTESFDEVILVDVSDLNGLEGKVNPEKVVELIDHHKVHEADKFPHAKTQIELVGAVATLVAEKFMQTDMDISKRSAILLSAAIISNSLNFKATHTTSRDRDAALWLNKTAMLSPTFAQELFLAKSDFSGGKLVHALEGDFAHFEFCGKKIGIAQIEMIGAEKLVDDHKEEILTTLARLKEAFAADFIFLSIIELQDDFNLFVTDAAATQVLITDIFGITFHDNIAHRDGLIMRKQITPLIKSKLEIQETLSSPVLRKI